MRKLNLNSSDEFKYLKTKIVEKPCTLSPEALTRNILIVPLTLMAVFKIGLTCPSFPRQKVSLKGKRGRKKKKRQDQEEYE